MGFLLCLRRENRRRQFVDQPFASRRKIGLTLRTEILRPGLSVWPSDPENRVSVAEAGRNDPMRVDAWAAHAYAQVREF